MTTPNFQDFLTNSPAAEAFRAAHPTTSSPVLTKADIDTALSSLRAVALEQRSPQDRAATSIVEERIAQRIDRHPVTVTRAIAMREVFEADPQLYEKYRAETTVGRDGQVLDRNPSAHNEGIGRVAAKSGDESVDAEVTRRVASVPEMKPPAKVHEQPFPRCGGIP